MSTIECVLHGHRIVDGKCEYCDRSENNIELNDSPWLLLGLFDIDGLWMALEDHCEWLERFTFSHWDWAEINAENSHHASPWEKQKIEKQH